MRWCCRSAIGRPITVGLAHRGSGPTLLPPGLPAPTAVDPRLADPDRRQPAASTSPRLPWSKRSARRGARCCWPGPPTPRPSRSATCSGIGELVRLGDLDDRQVIEIAPSIAAAVAVTARRRPPAWHLPRSTPPRWPSPLPESGERCPTWHEFVTRSASTIARTPSSRWPRRPVTSPSSRPWSVACSPAPHCSPPAFRTVGVAWTSRPTDSLPGRHRRCRWRSAGTGTTPRCCGKSTVNRSPSRRRSVASRWSTAAPRGEALWRLGEPSTL